MKNKKRIFQIILLTSTAISLFYVPWAIIWAWLPPIPDTIEEQLEDGLDYGFEGIIVYVDQKGKEPQFYAAGWHDRDKKIPADPNALFKIASVGKLYHAVAIAKLVGDGKLSLDGTLAEYFPELKERIENADQITLRMMVQHRSGIPNYTNYPNYWANPPQSVQAILELVLDEPSSFEPDQGYEYSNTNYLLISELIEKVTGGKAEYFKIRIFEPLGLKNTFMSMDEMDMDRLMSGYYVGVDRDLKTDNLGGIIATAEDVGIFLRALNDGSLFENGEQDIYSSIYVYNHTGLIPGYQTIAEYHLDLDAVVIQFTNTVNFEGYNWNLSEVLYNRVVKILGRG